jgi:hypothetical protein
MPSGGRGMDARPIGRYKVEDARPTEVTVVAGTPGMDADPVGRYRVEDARHIDGDVETRACRLATAILFPNARLIFSPRPSIINLTGRRATHSKVWILLLARRHHLRVHWRQGLGTLQWQTRHDWSDAVHQNPITALGTVANKSRLLACCRDLGAGATSTWCGLARRRLRGGSLSGRRLRGLGERRAKHSG